MHTNPIDVSPFHTGRILLAMPSMGDPRFFRSAIYICGHDSNGAMGIKLNDPIKTMDWPTLIKQLGLPLKTSPDLTSIPILDGGPLETGRGFVLHGDDYFTNTSVIIEKPIALTATLEILRSISDGSGPKEFLVALGYTGWNPGQIEQEILENSWISIPATRELLFTLPPHKKWKYGLSQLGITIDMLSDEVGHS